MDEVPDEAAEEPVAVGRFGRVSSALGGTPRRFRSNLASGHSLLRGRRRRSRLPRPRIHWRRYLVVAAFAVLLAATVLDLPVGAYHDRWPPELMAAASAITDIGRSIWILVPAGIAIVFANSLDWRLWGRRRQLFLFEWLSVIGYIFFSVAAAALVCQIVKYCVGRARPVHFDALGAFALEPFSDLSFVSFPSGHSTTIGSLFAALALLFPRYRLIFLIAAPLLASTRILVGAHYPSDVVAGLAWGAWMSYFSAMLLARSGLIFTHDGRGWPVPRAGSRFVRRFHRGRDRPRRRAPSD